PQLDRADQRFAHHRDGILITDRIVDARDRLNPVAEVPFAAMAVEHEAASRVQFAYVAEEAMAVFVERLIAVDHITIEMVEIGRRTTTRQRNEEFHLGSKIETGFVLHHIKWFFAEAISRQGQLIRRLVVESESPHAFTFAK